MPGRSIFHCLIHYLKYPEFERLVIIPFLTMNRKINSSIIRLDGCVSAVKTVLLFEKYYKKFKKVFFFFFFFLCVYIP